MYHYFKWAALSFFFRRNVRYLVLIVIGIAGIYLSDAIYQDMAKYLAMTKQSGQIGYYLLAKWVAVIFFSALTVWSIFGLGLRRQKDKKRDNKPKRKEKIPDNDPYMKRLENFKTKKKLRSKSDFLMQKKKNRQDDLPSI